jgi:hypothetical protein
MKNCLYSLDHLWDFESAVLKKPVDLLRDRISNRNRNKHVIWRSPTYAAAFHRHLLKMEMDFFATLKACALA